VGTFNAALHPRGPNGRFTRSFARHMNSLDAQKATKARSGFKARALRGTEDARRYLGGLFGSKKSGGGPAGIRQHLDSGALGRANASLRAGKSGPEVQVIDKEMRPLPHDLDLYRSVPASKFGHVDPKSLDGMLVSDAGYFPTTVAPQKGGPGTVQLHVQAPAGTKAAVDPDSGQVVLGHGAEMAVDSVDVAPDGSTRMNLVALPGEGESAPADAPAAPTPAADAPAADGGGSQPGSVAALIDGGVPSLLDNSEEALQTRERLRQEMGAIVNGTYGDIRVEVSRVNRYLGGPDLESPGVQLGLVLRDADGNTIGRGIRNIYRDDDGNLVAVHELLEIEDENMRGGGLASALNAHLTEWYREQGVGRIELHANIDVGGYAWASHGYDFANEDSANSVMDRLRSSLDGVEGPQADAGRALLARAGSEPFGSANYPTPFEISQLGRPEGAAGQGRGAKWLGKDVMLGSSWEGTKWL